MLKSKIIFISLIGLMTIGTTGGIKAFAAEPIDTELTLEELILDQGDTIESEPTQSENDRATKLSGFTSNVTASVKFKELTDSEREEIKTMISEARQIAKSEKKVEIAAAIAQLQTKKEDMLNEKMNEIESNKAEFEAQKNAVMDEKLNDFRIKKEASDSNREVLTDEKKAELASNKTEFEAQKNAIMDEKKAELASNKTEFEAQKNAVMDEKKAELVK